MKFNIVIKITSANAGVIFVKKCYNIEKNKKI